MAILSSSIEVLFDLSEYGDDLIGIRDIWNAYEVSKEIEEDTDSIIEIKNDILGLTFDGLSELLYNTRNYWWLIALVSGIQNPFLIGSDVIDEVSNPSIIRAINGDVLNRIVIGLRNR
jgi:hypothetical protein